MNNQYIRLLLKQPKLGLTNYRAAKALLNDVDWLLTKKATLLSRIVDLVHNYYRLHGLLHADISNEYMRRLTRLESRLFRINRRLHQL